MRRSMKFLSWSMSSAQNMYKRQLQESEDQMSDSGRGVSYSLVFASRLFVNTGIV